MFTGYKDMYDCIKDEKILMDKRLELVRFANGNGIKAAARFYRCIKTQSRNGVADMLFMVMLD